jgi:hypothetical protein
MRQSLYRKPPTEKSTENKAFSPISKNSRISTERRSCRRKRHSQTAKNTNYPNKKQPEKHGNVHFVEPSENG